MKLKTYVITVLIALFIVLMLIASVFIIGFASNNALLKMENEVQPNKLLLDRITARYELRKEYMNDLYKHYQRKKYSKLQDIFDKWEVTKHNEKVEDQVIKKSE